MKAFSLYHPLVLFLYFLSILLAAMFLFHPVLQAEALLGAVLFQEYPSWSALLGIALILTAIVLLSTGSKNCRS